MPPEATDHFRAASREQLHGIRALMDHWIGASRSASRCRRQIDREEIPID